MGNPLSVLRVLTQVLSVYHENNEESLRCFRSSFKLESDDLTI